VKLSRARQKRPRGVPYLLGGERVKTLENEKPQVSGLWLSSALSCVGRKKGSRGKGNSDTASNNDWVI